MFAYNAENYYDKSENLASRTRRPRSFVSNTESIPFHVHFLFRLKHERTL